MVTAVVAVLGALVILYGASVTPQLFALPSDQRAYVLIAMALVASASAIVAGLAIRRFRGVRGLGGWKLRTILVPLLLVVTLLSAAVEAVRPAFYSGILAVILSFVGSWMQWREGQRVRRRSGTNPPKTS